MGDGAPGLSGEIVAVPVVRRRAGGAARLRGRSRLAGPGRVTAPVRAILGGAGHPALAGPGRGVAGLARRTTAARAAGPAAIIAALAAGAVRGAARVLRIALVRGALATTVAAGQRPVAALIAGTALGRRLTPRGGAALATRRDAFRTFEAKAVVRAAVAVLRADAAGGPTLGATQAAATTLALAVVLAVVLLLTRTVATVAPVLAFGVRLRVIELRQQATQAHVGEDAEQPAPGAGGACFRAGGRMRSLTAPAPPRLVRGIRSSSQLGAIELGLNEQEPRRRHEHTTILPNEWTSA